MKPEWILTRRGYDYFLSGHEAATNTIDIADVGSSLAQINRYCGHARRPYSVAEHSLLCAEMARVDGHSALVQLLCLMHDGHEAITGDVSSPVKAEVGPAWMHFEQMQERRFRQQFGLQVGYVAYRNLVRHYDLVALATERRDLLAFNPARNLLWSVIDTPGQEVPPWSKVDLNAPHNAECPWHLWRDSFIERFLTLTRQAMPDAEHLQRLSFPA